MDGPVPQKDKEPWKAWEFAIDTTGRFLGTFQCEVHTAAEVGKLDDKGLHGYAAICVFQMVPDEELWQKLARYVREGGGLVLVPGGSEMLPKRTLYNEEGTKAGLLPGTLEDIRENPRGRPLVGWSDFKVKHPIPAFFEKAIQTSDVDFGKDQSRPGVNAYWRVKPADKDTVALATYDDGQRNPVLLDRAVGRGHVLLFTTPLDIREVDTNRLWHNYWGFDSSFGLVLVDRVCRYLAGDEAMPELNYFCGQAAQASMPPASSVPPYTLDGPGLAVAETNVKVVEGEARLALPQAVAPGNYAVRDGNKRIVAGCSLNVRPREGNLERVPAEEITAVLGKDTLLQVGRTISLKDALLGLRPPPVELLPWLMMAVLIVLTIESVLANRFYRRAAPAETPAAGEQVHV